MPIQLPPDDFTRLRNILADVTEFKIASDRLDFVNEMLESSPRKGDIIGRYRIDGAARAAAGRLITQLRDFGQDKPNHESIHHLLNILLDYHGEGDTANFLRDLQIRFPPHATDSGGNPPTASPSPTAPTDGSISVGNISGSTGVAIGAGASVNVTNIYGSSPAAQNQPQADGEEGWTAKQSQQLNAALLSAFDHDSLQRMIRFAFGKSLGTIVAPGSLTDVVFALVETAEREGWVIDLVREAHQFNPGNRQLAAVAAQVI